ncbi:hypothetical protein RYX36_008249, partial [Vicia faba]
MKNTFKDPDQNNLHSSLTFSKLITFLFLLISISYIFYSLKFITHSYICDQNHQNSDIIPIIHNNHTNFQPQIQNPFQEKQQEQETLINISHIVFRIGASVKLWKKRKRVHQTLVQTRP